jgi:hypothetical protein
MPLWMIAAVALAALWRWWVLERRLARLIASLKGREKLGWLAAGAGLRRP